MESGLLGISPQNL